MSNLKVKLTPQENLLITNYRIFQGSTVKLADIFDVQIEDPVTGAMLMYDDLADRWISKTTINSENVQVDGGIF